VDNGLALIVFAALGGTAAWRLWKLRHPEALPAPAPEKTAAADSPSDEPLV
jgi:hypothetical protein